MKLFDYIKNIFSHNSNPPPLVVDNGSDDKIVSIKDINRKYERRYSNISDSDIEKYGYANLSPVVEEDGGKITVNKENNIIRLSVEREEPKKRTPEQERKILESL